MNIYIAGKWSDKEYIRQLMKQITTIGYKITHDWTHNETLTRSQLQLQRNAKLDIDGVMGANILLAIMTDSDYEYRGTFTEIGCAIGAGKKVLIYCPKKDIHAKTNCFYYHPSIIHFDNWNGVIDYLQKI